MRTPRRALQRILTLPNRVGRLESRARLQEQRIATVELDLDADIENGLAWELAELHADVQQLRARIKEWELGMADVEQRKDAA